MLFKNFILLFMMLCLFVTDIFSQKANYTVYSDVRNNHSSVFGASLYNYNDYNGVSLNWKDVDHFGGTISLVLMPIRYDKSSFYAVKYSHNFVTQTFQLSRFSKKETYDHQYRHDFRSTHWIDFSPYVFAFLGTGITTQDPPAAPATYYLTGNVGFGLEFIFQNRFGLNLEIGGGNIPVNAPKLLNLSYGIGFGYYFNKVL